MDETSTTVPELSQDEKDELISDMTLDLEHLNDIKSRFPSRELSLTITKIQEAIMWAREIRTAHEEADAQ